MASGYQVSRSEGGRTHPRIGRCRDCKEPIIWAAMPSGKRNALDVEPIGPEYGKVTLIEHDGDDWKLGLHVEDVELRRELASFGHVFHRSHFEPGACRARMPRERADLA